ncbi:hypothetical protein [Yinghuangia soli]|uniref:Uncharacterized protein n=1 Tax=Yinghuangia soli TaxID=2908204 RepID=A0AA41U8Z5_9ACTN|nr:hypothetical protein [Yinghuangia soli]MCF2533384.1 hypothetical protein [Yinghuangia soli]
MTLQPPAPQDAVTGPHRGSAAPRGRPRALWLLLPALGIVLAPLMVTIAHLAIWREIGDFHPTDATPIAVGAVTFAAALAALTVAVSVRRARARRRGR